MELQLGLVILIACNALSMLVFLVALWRASRHVRFDVFQLSTMAIYLVLLLCKTHSNTQAR